VNGRAVHHALAGVGILCLLGAIGILANTCLSGCGLLRSPEAAEATYTAEHLRCVDKSQTLAESHACRDAVDKRWGITHTLRKDAGQ